MMHGREKSDPAIVAVKPTNATERSAAEPVEPRAGAEGNASQHSTGRRQSRETVTQGLERIRQVRRQTPKVGAVCLNWARTVLCGGRSVMSVPTAIALRALVRMRGCDQSDIPIGRLNSDVAPSVDVTVAVKPVGTLTEGASTVIENRPSAPTRVSPR